MRMNDTTGFLRSELINRNLLLGLVRIVWHAEATGQKARPAIVESIEVRLGVSP
jgi:hypothetical protein